MPLLLPLPLIVVTFIGLFASSRIRIWISKDALIPQTTNICSIKYLAIPVGSLRMPLAFLPEKAILFSMTLR